MICGSGGKKKYLKHDLTCEAVGRLASQKALVGGIDGGDKSKLGRSAGEVRCDWQ